MLLVFSWKPALKMTQYVKMQNFHIFESALLEVRLLELLWEFDKFN